MNSDILFFFIDKICSKLGRVVITRLLSLLVFIVRFTVATKQYLLWIIVTITRESLYSTFWCHQFACHTRNNTHLWISPSPLWSDRSCWVCFRWITRESQSLRAVMQDGRSSERGCVGWAWSAFLLSYAWPRRCKWLESNPIECELSV